MDRLVIINRMITCFFEDSNKVNLRHATVNTIVLSDGKILLGKRAAKLLEAGKWGLTGGFIDRDETITQAAAREVYEESGWTIKDLTLLTIRDNPDRPNEDRQNIDFVFFASAIEQTGTPDWESDEIRWFALDDLPPIDQIAFDHASDIELYKRYIKEGFSLPALKYI